MMKSVDGVPAIFSHNFLRVLSNFLVGGLPVSFMLKKLVDDMYNGRFPFFCIGVCFNKLITWVLVLDMDLGRLVKYVTEALKTDVSWHVHLL